MLRRTAVLATTGALALGGVAVLVPTAASAKQDAVSQVADQVASQVDRSATGRARLLNPAQRQELRTTGHLSLTKNTKRFGKVTVLVQPGEVTALSPTSISLKSKDGYSHSYVIKPVTKVREKGEPVPLSDLKVGERAMVIAVVTKDGDVARRISCVRPAAGSTT